MKSTINSKSSKPVLSFPCLLVHQGDIGCGDAKWKDSVVLFNSPSEGTVVHAGEKLSAYGVGSYITGASADSVYWKPFEGNVVLSN